MYRFAIASVIVIVGIAAVVLVSGLGDSESQVRAQADQPLGPPAPSDVVVKDPRPGQLDDPGPVTFNTRGWATDFTVSAVPFSEIFSGGVPKDGIPGLDIVKVQSLREAMDAV